MIRIAAVCLLLALTLWLDVGVAEPEEPAPPAALKELSESDRNQKAVLRGLLASEDGREVAWGAYEAARRSVRKLVPALLGLATKRKTSDGATLDEHAWRSVLAALVDLEARAPRALLLRLRGCGVLQADPAAILAIRNGSKEDMLALWDAAARG